MTPALIIYAGGTLELLQACVTPDKRDHGQHGRSVRWDGDWLAAEVLKLGHTAAA